MTMLTLQGTIANVLLTPAGTSKDGSEYGGYHQVQLMCEEDLKNGEKRLALFTLRTDQPAEFQELLGSTVRVPVGVFARAGTLNFYMQRGASPEQV